jgi:hypothetical protein
MKLQPFIFTALVGVVLGFRHLGTPVAGCYWSTFFAAPGCARAVGTTGTRSRPT